MATKTVLVTGVNGFVGQHLAKELVAAECAVIGSARSRYPALAIREVVNGYTPCDLTRPADVRTLPLKEADAVINLAGLAAVGPSFENPGHYIYSNTKVTSTLAERIRELGRRDLRFIAVSTGAVYASNQPMPLTEASTTDWRSSPYAASKLSMEAAAVALRQEGYEWVVARPFNHIGPGQEGSFLVPNLLQELRPSNGGQIRVGNLATERDYTDVRDVARAYISLVKAEELTHDIYNVCSGMPTSGFRILEMLKAACGLSGIKVVVDSERCRPTDPPQLYGDNSRIYEATGWQPTIPLSQTIADIVAAA